MLADMIVVESFAGLWSKATHDIYDLLSQTRHQSKLDPPTPTTRAIENEWLMVSVYQREYSRVCRAARAETVKLMVANISIADGS